MNETMLLPAHELLPRKIFAAAWRWLGLCDDFRVSGQRAEFAAELRLWLDFVVHMDIPREHFEHVIGWLESIHVGIGNLPEARTIRRELNSVMMQLRMRQDRGDCDDLLPAHALAVSYLRCFVRRLITTRRDLESATEYAELAAMMRALLQLFGDHDVAMVVPLEMLEQVIYQLQLVYLDARVGMRDNQTVHDQIMVAVNALRRQMGKSPDELEVEPELDDAESVIRGRGIDWEAIHAEDAACPATHGDEE